MFAKPLWRGLTIVVLTLAFLVAVGCAEFAGLASDAQEQSRIHRSRA